MEDRVVIYGAGNYGRKLYSFLKEIKCKVDFFCQTEVENNNTCCDVPVISADALINMEGKRIVLIAVADNDVSSLIKAHLQDVGQELLMPYDCGRFIRENLECCADAVLYSGDAFERKMFEGYWRDYFEDSCKLENATESLLANLTDEDKEEVCKIIERMRQILYSEDFNPDIFSYTEKVKIKKMERSFYGQIKKDECIENVWVWDKYKMHERHFEPSVFYYQCGVPSLQICSWGQADVIDAGAYIGDSSVVLSYYTEGNVYAFEAFKENFDKINAIAELNNRTNIIPVNMALGKKEGAAEFYVMSKDNPTGHGMVKRIGKEYKESINVRCISLDRFVQEKHLNVGLIKADIEGAEQDLIEGAERTIREQKPALLISIYHTADDFFMIKGKIEKIQPEYKFRIFRPVGRGNILAETMLICEV